MSIKRRHFSNFDIAGFTYWDGCLVLNDLEVGTKLTLVREEDNKFDPYAVAIYYEDNKIGYVPRNCNSEISKFLDCGHQNIFDVRINRISPEVYPENQIGVIVFIIDKE